jgi:hypothetical protein
LWGFGYHVRGGQPLHPISPFYPTLHEPINCFAPNPGTGITVEVTDAVGKFFVANVSSDGNFLKFAEGSMAFPIKARVVGNGRVREMFGAQMSGDCNLCHNPEGKNGAPGRILMP